MKKILILVILFIYNTNAQNIILDEAKEEIIKGIPNRVKISNSKNYILKINNGKVEKHQKGIYYIYPKKIGSLTLTLKNRNQKIIEQKSFKVRDVIFSAYIMSVSEYISDLKRFCCTFGISLLTNDLVCTNFPYTGKYNLEIKRNDLIIFKTSSDDLKWSEETIENFKKLENGDEVVISNIFFIIGDNKYEASPISLKVKI